MLLLYLCNPLASMPPKTQPSFALISPLIHTKSTHFILSLLGNVFNSSHNTPLSHSYIPF